MTTRYTWAAALAGIFGLSSLLVAAPAFAATTQQPQSGVPPHGPYQGHMMGERPAAIGTVSAINGTTLTVQDKGWGANAQAQTYTVDASNATVDKNRQSASLSDIAVGDTVIVHGTVNGTTITATEIHDGIPQRGRDGWQKGAAGALQSIQGNGEPVIGGTVSAVNGSTLTVGTKAGTSYTVDASGATVVKDNATSSVSAIASGDEVIVQGSVQGTQVSASSVIDHGTPPVQSGNGQSAQAQSGQGNQDGFFHRMFGGIGGFFRNLFGFF